MRVYVPLFLSLMFLAVSVWSGWYAVVTNSSIGLLCAVCYFAAVGFGIRAAEQSVNCR